METAMRGVALNEFATDLCNQLLEQGFIVYRYDAYSTNSVYLKLDFGVCNSIRISDHKGKGYLKYRYNIGSHIKEKGIQKDRYPRFYYPTEEVREMVKKICSDRDEKVKRYGQQRYEQFMGENKKEHANDKGFWAKSRRVL